MAAKGWHKDARVQELTKAIRAGGRFRDIRNLISRFRNLLGPDSDEQIAEYALNNHILDAVGPYLDQDKVKQYYGARPFHFVQNDDINKELRASCEAMQARGGLSAAVDALSAGSPDGDVLLAAKALAGLLDGADPPDQLASSDIVRRILLSIEHPDLQDAGKGVVEISVCRLITQCRGFAEAFVAAYGNPDTHVAFAALCFSLHAITSETACAVLRKAGLAQAVVAMLSHASMYCRSQAVFLCGSSLL